MIWRIAGEQITLLGGASATILQVSHPKVGQGVEDHSGFRTDMLGRLERTLAAIYAIAYGDRQAILAMQAKVAEIHKGIRGQTDEGAPYSAFEQDLQLWVIATLVTTAARLYETFVTPLSLEEKQRYLDDMRVWGEFFGLDRHYGPQEWNAFIAYYEEMIHGPLLGSRPVCISVAQGIANPTRPLWLRIVTRPLAFIHIELLPEPLRSRLGFRSTAWTRFAWGVTCRVGRIIYPRLPWSMRLAPPARRAWRRTERGAPPR